MPVAHYDCNAFIIVEKVFMIFFFRKKISPYLAMSIKKERKAVS